MIEILAATVVAQTKRFFIFFAFAKPTGSLPMLTEQLGGEVSPGEAGSQKIRAIELKSAVS